MDHYSTHIPSLHTGCAQPYISMAMVIGKAQWHLTAKAIQDLSAWIVQKKVTVTGSLFYRYRTVSNDHHMTELEVGFPVSKEVDGDDRVTSGLIPQGTYATTLHCGSRTELHHSYDALQLWSHEQGLQWMAEPTDKGTIWPGRFDFCLDQPAIGTHRDHKRIAIAIMVEPKEHLPQPVK